MFVVLNCFHPSQFCWVLMLSFRGRPAWQKRTNSSASWWGQNQPLLCENEKKKDECGCSVIVLKVSDIDTLLVFWRIPFKVSCCLFAVFITLRCPQFFHPHYFILYLTHLSSRSAVRPADGESRPERRRRGGSPQAAGLRPEHGPSRRHWAVRDLRSQLYLFWWLTTTKIAATLSHLFIYSISTLRQLYNGFNMVLTEVKVWTPCYLFFIWHFFGTSKMAAMGWTKLGCYLFLCQCLHICCLNWSLIHNVLVQMAAILEILSVIFN